MADSVKSVTATATLNVSTALKFIPQGPAVSQKERRRALVWKLYIPPWSFGHVKSYGRMITRLDKKFVSSVFAFAACLLLHYVTGIAARNTRKCVISQTAIMLRTALRKGWNRFDDPPPCVFLPFGDLMWLWIGIWSKVLCDSYSSMPELVLTLVELTQQRQQEQQKSTYLVKSQICDFCTLCRPCTCFFIYIYTYGREEIGSEVQRTTLNFQFAFYTSIDLFTASLI